MVDAGAQQAVGDARPVDRRDDQVLAQDGRVEVEHALAEAVAGRGPSVVRDVRRQQRHGRAERAVVVAVEVVADDAVVDDQQRPRVVRVERVGVGGEARVEDLGDPRDRRSPSRDDRHVKNVQDAGVAPARVFGV